MRKSAGWFILFLFFAQVLFGQQSNRSTIRIRLSDNNPLLVTINGRDYKKMGRAITIGDIPRKRQDIQVYRFRPYADGKGGKAELVYSGRIKLEKGATYDAIVDIGTRKFRMKKVRQLPTLVSKEVFNPRTDQPLHAVDEIEPDTDLEMPPQKIVDARLEPLKKTMDIEDADSKKLTKALNFIQKNTITTQDVKTIAGWIFFDDNRLAFVRQAFVRVTDKENYSSIAEIFTLESSKRNFLDFLNNQ